MFLSIFRRKKEQLIENILLMSVNVWTLQSNENHTRNLRRVLYSIAHTSDRTVLIQKSIVKVLWISVKSQVSTDQIILIFLNPQVLLLGDNVNP